MAPPSRTSETLSPAQAAALTGHVVVPSGDPALTRALLARGAVRVVRPRRGRMEQVGVVTTPDLLAIAQAEVDATAGRRAVSRDRSRERRAREEAEYRADFEAALRALYPSMPAVDRDAVVEQACEVSSGRVGRSAEAKTLAEEPLRLAACARIRHEHTDYEERLERAGVGQPFGRCSREARSDARRAIQSTVDAVERSWRAPAVATRVVPPVTDPAPLAAEPAPLVADPAPLVADPAPPRRPAPRPVKAPARSEEPGVPLWSRGLRPRKDRSPPPA